MVEKSGCGETVKEVWEAGSVVKSMPLVEQKIKECGTQLTEWSRHSFGSIRHQLEEKTKELIRAEWEAARGSDTTAVRTVQMEVNELLDKESLMWQ